MRRILWLAAVLLLLAVATGLWLTRPASLPEGFAAGHQPDPEAGALIFRAAGCASCHAAPGAKDDAKLILAGGLAFPSDFGTFYAPNISPDTDHGIGSWDLAQFARAVTLGVSPGGQHYYPAFPYGAYANMLPQDVADLFAYIQALPAATEPSRSHDVGFPFNIRRGLGLWKLAFLPKGFVVEDPLTEVEARGRYLAEALAHCGECHTPRNAVGGLDLGRWLAGAPNPSGKGRIPNITPEKLDWSEADLVAYFTSGLTPDYDSVGGEMAAVVDNLSGLPKADREALAAYLKRVPGQP